MESSIKSLIDESVCVFNVIGPIIVYIPQYLLMSKNRSVGSFSCFICYIMLAAHILRLIFHQIINYHISLYLQSYLMIIIHFILLYQYIRVSHLQALDQNFDVQKSVTSESTQQDLDLMDCEKNTTKVNLDQLQIESESTLEKTLVNESHTKRDHVGGELMDTAETEDKHEALVSEVSVSTNLDTKDSARDDTEYMLNGRRDSLTHEGALTVDQQSNLGLSKSSDVYKRKFYRQARMFVLFGLAYFILFRMINEKWFANWTALISCMCESMLPVPQFIANWRMKSFESLSFFMVFCWLFGDVMKFFFLIDEGQPLQFVVGTANIIIFDTLIVIQYFLYRNNPVKLKKPTAKVLNKARN